VKENYEARYLQKPLAYAFLVMLNAVKHLVGRTYFECLATSSTSIPVLVLSRAEVPDPSYRQGDPHPR